MAERYCAENMVFHAGQRTLIDDVSLTLSQGELVALIGPNGAGNRPCYACLPAISNPRADGAVWRERRLRPPPDRLSRYRAVMRQNTQLGFDWPVEAVIGMGRAPWTRRPEASVIEEVMAISGCLPLAGRQFAALSGGEQQRVQLARALAQLWCDGAPRGWLFLDEPTSALDLYHQQHLLRLLSSLTRRGICMSVWCCTISIWRRCGRIGSCCYITAKWSLRGPGGGSAGRYADALVRRAGAGGRHPAHAAPQVFLVP